MATHESSHIQQLEQVFDFNHRADAHAPRVARRSGRSIARRHGER
jgi:hypothetical protein